MQIESNLSRLILTGAWLDVAYFEDNLLFVQKKQTTIRKLYTYIKMKNFNLHTINLLPQLSNKIWAGNCMFSSQEVDYTSKLEDTDVG